MEPGEDGALQPEEQPAETDTPATCGHEHDALCGYAEVREVRPCEYVCELCIVEWTWVDEEEGLIWSGEAGKWGLGIPGASEENPVTPEVLEAVLPAGVTAVTKAGTEAVVNLVWDFSGFPEGATLGGLHRFRQSGRRIRACRDGPSPGGASGPRRGRDVC